MSDDSEFVAGCFALLVIIPIIFLCSALFGGLLVYVVWNYAVVAAFGAHALTFFQSILIAAGLSFVGGCFKATINKVSKD